MSHLEAAMSDFPPLHCRGSYEVRTTSFSCLNNPKAFNDLQNEQAVIMHAELSAVLHTQCLQAAAHV